MSDYPPEAKVLLTEMMAIWSAVDDEDQDAICNATFECLDLIKQDRPPLKPAEKAMIMFSACAGAEAMMDPEEVHPFSRSGFKHFEIASTFAWAALDEVSGGTDDFEVPKWSSSTA